MSKYLILSALLLGSALAQTTAPTTTDVSVPGTLPAAVKTELDALKAFLAAGGKVQLLNTSGAVIGTLNADGTVTLSGTSTLKDVTSVRATAPNGTATSYVLARDLSKPGAIKLQWTQSNGKVASLPLSAIVNRVSKSATTTAPTADRTSSEAEKAEAEKAKAKAEAERLKADAKAKAEAEKERAEAEQEKAEAEKAREQEKAAKSDRPTKPERPNNKK